MIRRTAQLPAGKKGHHAPARGHTLLCLAGGITLLMLAGCGGHSNQMASWDGRRVYDGNGDYGYDPEASREAAVLEARASRNYPAPGSSSDPWGPYISKAAFRFNLPEAWIRAVMQ